MLSDGEYEENLFLISENPIGFGGLGTGLDEGGRAVSYTHLTLPTKA